ncbi:hypothetical protein SBA2_270103 [Acidobacteriia bacterium SbA2]|nr:hypothetical protein SBA2_270103 [Acidobacteriia bacterium SbA2]
MASHQLHELIDGQLRISQYLPEKTSTDLFMVGNANRRLSGTGQADVAAALADFLVPDFGEHLDQPPA